MEKELGCPVDHSTRSTWSSLLWNSKKGSEVKDSGILATAAPGDDQPKCPVDHNTRSDWLKKVSVTTPEAIEESTTICTSDKLAVQGSVSDLALPTDRTISSIPRTDSNGNWIYPSEKQFYDAMTRKKWNPQADDMKTVVPIHNMVNERTWNYILNWERSFYAETVKKCGGVKLTSFQGNPMKLTPRAWFRSNIMGLPKPFDRHDWLVDRCGTQVEYVIDFYSGDDKSPVFLDVRPKLNTWEGVKLRVGRAVGWL